MGIARTLTVLFSMAGALSATGAIAAPALLSPMWPFQIVFDTPPTAAKPRPGSPCEVALQYATYITTDHAAMVPSLFAADGAFIGPENRVLHGAEIAQFYDAVHQKGAIPISFIDAQHECIMELANLRPTGIAGEAPKYKLSAIDHFTIGRDRKIERLAIFFRDNVVHAPGTPIPDPNAAPPPPAH